MRRLHDYRYTITVWTTHLRRGMSHDQAVEDGGQLVEDVLVLELSDKPGRERHAAAAEIYYFPIQLNYLSAM